MVAAYLFFINLNIGGACDVNQLIGELFHDNMT